MLRLSPCSVSLSSDSPLLLASLYTQLHRVPIESKQHNTIREPGSIIINNLGSEVNRPYKCLKHKSHKSMEENLNSFIDNQERSKRVTTSCFDPTSSSQKVSPSSPHEKSRSPNTMMLPQETNSNSVQDEKFQRLDL